MKLPRIVAFTSLALLTSSVWASSPSLTTDNDKLSYTIGVDLGKNFKKQDIPINADLLRAGMLDAQNGKSLRLTQEQMEQTLKKFQQSIMAKKQNAHKAAAELNKQDGLKFLAENKKKAGVVTLASGLQYKILKAGNGKKPAATDTVTVEYTGRLINGTVFDTTEKRGKPVSFKVREVIPGWTEALQLMPTGSTWEIYVPSELAYGARGIGGPIGPNQTLIFKIHLIKTERA